MLVLTRKKNERIAIADRSGKVIAVLTLVEAGGGKGRIGFDASDELTIRREEVYTRIYSKVPVVGE